MKKTKWHRRSFLAALGASAGSLAQARACHKARGPSNETAVSPLAPSRSNAEPKFHLGIVTYNIAAEWDVPTILKVCKEVGLFAVELRTTHKHGVEPTISPE